MNTPTRQTPFDGDELLLEPHFFICSQVDDGLRLYGAEVATYRKNAHLLSVAKNGSGRPFPVDDDSFFETRSNDEDSTLSEKAFAIERDREFFACCKRLGLAPAGVHFYQKRPFLDVLTLENTADMIRYYVEHYPKTKLRVPSPLVVKGQTLDHIALGIAAFDLHVQGAVDEVRFFVHPDLKAAYSTHYPSLILAETPAPYGDEDISPSYHHGIEALGDIESLRSIYGSLRKLAHINARLLNTESTLENLRTENETLASQLHDVLDSRSYRWGLTLTALPRALKNRLKR